MIDPMVLLDYWFGDLSLEEAEQVEAHFFACAECTARLEELARTGKAMRAAVRNGAVQGFVTASLIDRLARDGVRTRTHRLAPGEIVPCTVSWDDQVVVTELSAPLAGVERVDAVAEDNLGSPPVRTKDIPIDRATGRLYLISRASDIARLPRAEITIRAIAVDGTAERTLGEYRLSHTPPA